ncbi:hypothetical protein LINGRAHAP2_LOCUS14700 [Linum grandiflorum]
MACIGESNGVLALQYVMAATSTLGLVVWSLDGPYYEEKWSMGFGKSLADIEKEHAAGYDLYLLDRIRFQRLNVESGMDLLAFRDGILILRAGNTVFLYNTLIVGMDRVAHVSDLGAGSLFSLTVIPYSMSLVPVN